MVYLKEGVDCLIQMCRIIDRSPPKASKLEKAIAAASLYYNYANTKKCFDLAGNHDPHGLNLWGWQVYNNFDFNLNHNFQVIKLDFRLLINLYM